MFFFKKYTNFLKIQTYCINFYYDYKNKKQILLNRHENIFLLQKYNIKIHVLVFYILNIIRIFGSVSVSVFMSVYTIK